VKPIRSSRRLLAVCAVDHPGGAELALVRLAERLAPRGWEIALTTPGRGPLSEVAHAQGWGWSPLAVGRLGATRRGRLRAAASWPRARRLTADADVVYLNASVCGRLLPAVAARRTVLHIHDMVARVPAHWHRADVVLADSEAVGARLGDLGDLSSHVVHCPVELDPPPAARLWPADGRPTVGFVGRLEARKAPLDLVAAAPAIRARKPGVRIVIVGDDPYASNPDYVARVRSALGIEHHRWVDNAPGLMRHLDVLVVPSREEPFGTVAAEAMAVGTPVVASRVDGLIERIDDGVDGRLVSPGRPAELADAVLEVLEHRREMGAAAARAARRFDADAYADRVQALIWPTATPTG